MHEPDDNELLQDYVKQNSDAAFATLVARHINKVYSVALRHTGKPHQAEEITQTVFVLFAQKCRQFSKNVILSGWLYQTAHFTARTYIRTEIRRNRREEEAHMQTIVNQHEDDPWPQIAPLLDTALADLNEKDRHALVLRFFDNKTIREVGLALNAKEDAAQKRVNRAVEKLRHYFSKRGLILPAAALTATLAAHSVQAAPTALAQSTAAMALAKVSTTSASTLTLGKILKLMAWTKFKTTAVITLVVVATTSTTVVILKSNHTPLMATSTTPDWIWDSQKLERVPPMLVIQPTTLPANQAPYDQFGKGRYLARGKTVKQLLAAAYSQIDSRAQLIFQTELPDDKLDCIVTFGNRWTENLLTEIARRYDLTIKNYNHPLGNVVLINKPSPDSIADAANATATLRSIRLQQAAAKTTLDWIWNDQNLEYVPPMLVIQPITQPAKYVSHDMLGNDRYLALGKTVKELLAAVYSQKDSTAKLIFQTDLPDDKLDCIVTTGTGWANALEAEIVQRYHLTIKYENHPTGNVVLINKAP